MAPIMKYAAEYIVVVPVVLSFVTFILTTLALCAGHQKGFMEDYAVMRLNTSVIGQHVFGGARKASAELDQSNVFLEVLKGEWRSTDDAIKDAFGHAVGDAAGTMAAKLGVSEWYSIHVMNSCEGNYYHHRHDDGSGSSSHARLNVTRCSASSPTYRFNLTAVLDREMTLGPLRLSLASVVGWPSSVQDKVGELSDALHALFVFYVLGVALSGLTTVAAVPMYFFADDGREQKHVAMLNIALTSFAAFFLLLAGIVVTAAGVIGVSALNDAGRPISVSAQRGTKICVVSWVAAGLMVVLNLFWVGRLLVVRRGLRKRVVRESKLPC